MLDWLRSRISRATGPGEASAPAPAPTSVVREPLALYRAGLVDAAEEAARSALALDPGNEAALLTQALLLIDRQQPGAALALLERTIVASAPSAQLKLGIGRAQLALGKRSAAKKAFEEAHALAPDDAQPLLQLGVLAQSQGNEKEAARYFASALQADASSGEAHARLGILLRKQGQDTDAERHLRQAVAARPDDAEAASHLGSLLKERKQFSEAGVFLEQALRVQPQLATANLELGLMRLDQRQWVQAAKLLQRSLEANPQQSAANYWLGHALMGSGDAAGARKAYLAASKLDGKHERARWSHVMAQIPAVPQTHEEQAGASAAFGLELAKFATWLKAQRVNDAQAVGAVQPYYLAYIPQNHRAVLEKYGALCQSMMGLWARNAGIPSPVAAHGPKWRIGIVSAHIHSHSVWHALLKGWIEHLDPAQFEIHLFHTGGARDVETEWAARRVARLHHAIGDWTAWVKTVSDARLDVLIYPEIGMDETTTRLASLRLARVQLASWGHPITSGLPTLDGYLSAAAMEPEGAAQHYAEKLQLLPGLGCSYKPFDTRPTRPDLAAAGIGADDSVLLCAGTPFKYAPQDDAVLVDIARQWPSGKLVFFRGQPETLSLRFEQRLRQAFESAGLSFDASVRFVPWQAQAGFFGWLDRADVYLDTIGFSGFNTTMQAIERGVPVVAWEGEFLRGRFASTILRSLGLDEWVADTREGYVAKVLALCADRTRRDAVRKHIVANRNKLFDDRAAPAALGRLLLDWVGAGQRR